MELNTENIRALAKIMSEEKLTEITLDQENTKIKLKREVLFSNEAAPNRLETQTVVTTVPDVNETEAVKNTHWKEIKSPMVGVFYQSNQPNNPPYVTKGQHFKEGSTLCIIEAMKLMNEIAAETSGTIMEICAENGQIVEYGQVIFRVEED